MTSSTLLTPECAAIVKDLRLWAVEWQLTSEHVVVQAADAIERLAEKLKAAEENLVHFHERALHAETVLAEQDAVRVGQSSVSGADQ